MQSENSFQDLSNGIWHAYIHPLLDQEAVADLGGVHRVHMHPPPLGTKSKS